ncbi:MAG TPA: YihY/virulence factor BrkB family protein [Acidimicrobiia bacterium]|nr:YihY/virulence factor BrkB family protein [Acidimicrobiia bacterium]
MAAEAEVRVEDVVRRLPARIRDHNLTLVSAGVAFYAFLAFVPTLIVVVTIYGLVASTKDIQSQVHSFTSALPQEVENFISSQVRRIATADTAGLSITLVVAILIALWSASGGMSALVAGINVARGEERALGFVAKRTRGFILTLGAVSVLTVMIFLITALPPLIGDIGMGTGGRIALNVVRWPVVAVVMVIGNGVLYRIAAEDPPKARFGVVTPGTVVAMLTWLAASGLFAVYTANFSRYSRTYGSLSSIIVVMLWLYLSAFAVLLGAEVDGIPLDQDADRR